MKELNLGQVSDGSMTPGEYDLEFVSVKDAKSQNDNDCFDIVYKQVDGDGRHFERIPLLENTLWKLKRLVAAAGLDAEANWDPEDLKQDLTGCIIHARIEMVPRADTGEERAQIKSYSPAK